MDEDEPEAAYTIRLLQNRSPTRISARQAVPVALVDQSQQPCSSLTSGIGVYRDHL